MGEEQGNASSLTNNASLLPQDGSSQGSDARKVPRTLSFGATANHGGNSTGAAYNQTTQDVSLRNNGQLSSSNGIRPISSSGSPPQVVAKAGGIHVGMTDQQKLEAIREVIPAVSRKVTACAACR